MAILENKSITILVLLWSLGLSSTLLAKSAQIENVKLEVRDEKIVVIYDIVNFDVHSLFDIELEIISAITYDPVSVYGDVGKGVLGGSNKKIVWDVYKDLDELIGNVKARVTINNTSRPFGGGPIHTFKSVVYPGWGQHYVGSGEHKLFSNARGTITSSLYTLAVAGTVLSYIDFQTNWKPKYQSFDNELSFTTQKYQDEILGYREGGKKALRRADLFLSLVAVIWVSDVVSVYNKGRQNMRTNPYLKQQKKITPTLSFMSRGNRNLLMLGIRKVL